MAHAATSVLATEQRLARESDGRGWARDTVERLCVDRGGRLLEFCERDGERESYLNPRDHRIGVTLEGILPAIRVLRLELRRRRRAPRSVKTDCIEEVKLRVRYGRPTQASVDIILRDGTAQRVTTEIQVRDVLIAGMGDSIAAGDGNPDRAVRLSDDGFCFRRLSGGEYFRPGRAGFTGNRSCSAAAGDDPGTAEWTRQSARWMSGAVPPLALRLSDAHGARARGRIPAHRGHVPAARVLGRHRQLRFPRSASGRASARVPAPAPPVPVTRARRSPSSTT